LKGLRQICDERGWLLILDEVQSGMGRTGTWFAFQQSGVPPDIMTLAKGLGNGIPIGACLASGAAAKLFKPGSHGSTFGGNPFACAAAIETLAVIEEEGLMQNAVTLGDALRERFRSRLAGQPGVVDIRGQGLMIGIELAHPCGELVQQALDAGLLINVTADNVIRLLPPLNFTHEQCEMLVATLVPLVADFLARQSAPHPVAQSA
jgi:acetylornithine/N-succinyldiaminopimelate aminotransferase